MNGPSYNGGAQVHNTHLVDYSEPDALQVLMQAAHSAMVADLTRCDETGDFTTDQIFISVGGTTCAFQLGGPQLEALFDFVRHICAENMYALDIDNLEVKGW